MTQFVQAVTKSMKVRNLAVIFAMTLALAGFANAVTPAEKEHAVNVKHLEIKTPVEVGGAILPVGDYEVHEINTASGPELEFVQEYRNELASELLQANEEKTLARIPFTEQELSSRAKHTQLVSATDGNNAVALEIRGKSTEYIVGQTALDMNAKVGTPNDKAKNGQ